MSAAVLIILFHGNGGLAVTSIDMSSIASCGEQAVVMMRSYWVKQAYCVKREVK